MIISQESTEGLIETSFLALPAQTLVKQAIQAMGEARLSCVLIVDDRKPVGIFTERDVVRITTSTTSLDELRVCDVLTKELITLNISETSDVFILSQLLHQHNIRHLPIIDDYNHLVGIVTPRSIRNLIKPEYLLRYVRVSDVMNTHVICAFPEDSIFSVAQQMANNRVSCVVIVDRETYFPIGIITESDIVHFCHVELVFSIVPAQDVMSAPLSLMQPQDSLWNIRQRMQQLNVRRLVIAHPNGELAGLVTQAQLLKMLDPAEVHHVIQQMQDVIDRQTHDLQQLNQKLQVVNAELSLLSMMDELTQIVNRRRFNEFLKSQWESSLCLRTPLTLIMCDVDNFKAYNDIYGHRAGDDCLIKVAHALRDVVRRANGLVARYGGEEFAIVLPSTDIAAAETVSQDILAKIQSLQIPHSLSENGGHITVSLGSATIIPLPIDSADLLLETADRLLYQSKDKGRNTYSIEFLASDRIRP
jgi:diguanylate cyclase (GGDEF)-like protein